MNTPGTRYLLARANTDSRLAGLLDDLYRARFDNARCDQIQRTMVDLAWHRGVNEFEPDDAYWAADIRGSVTK